MSVWVAFEFSWLLELEMPTAMLPSSSGTFDTNISGVDSTPSVVSESFGSAVTLQSKDKESLSYILESRLTAIILWNL